MYSLEFLANSPFSARKRVDVWNICYKKLNFLCLLPKSTMLLVYVFASHANEVFR